MRQCGDDDSDSQHLLNGLPGHPELSGDVGLRQAVVEQAAHQLTPLRSQLLREAHMFQGLRSHLPQAAEGLFVRGLAWHAPSLTTGSCHVNATLAREIVSPSAIVDVEPGVSIC
jgi:hypothetical protein